MKGLIIKDIMCLKKQLTLFTFVIIAVLVLGVMYVLSARFGNIADMGREMLANQENHMTEVDVKNLSVLVMVLFMLLPIACVGDMVNVFVEDGKAGFAKVAAAIPIPISKRLLARFLTIVALYGIGAGVDILVAGILSTLTDLMSFGAFLGVIVSAASLLAIYSAVAVFYCILLGYGKEQHAQMLSILTMVAAFVILQFKGLKDFFVQVFIKEQVFNSDYWKPLDFVKEKGYVLFLIALITCAFSFVASLKIAERKRGVI